MDSNEREDLDALERSEGWRRFCAHVAQEWGDREGNGEMFRSAVVKAADKTDDEATAHLRQIICAQREIHRLMRWVSDRLKEVTKADAQTQKLELVQQSRRGSNL